MATTLERLQTRYAKNVTELAALEDQTTARGGVVEFGVGSQRVRFNTGQEVEARKAELRRMLETDEGRITALRGSV